MITGPACATIDCAAYGEPLPIWVGGHLGEMMRLAFPTLGAEAQRGNTICRAYSPIKPPSMECLPNSKHSASN